MKQDTMGRHSHLQDHLQINMQLAPDRQQRQHSAPHHSIFYGSDDHVDV